MLSLISVPAFNDQQSPESDLLRLRDAFRKTTVTALSILLCVSRKCYFYFTFLFIAELPIILC